MDKLFSYAINEWLNDIKTNQLQGLLSGVAPIHTLVKLGKCNSSRNNLRWFTVFVKNRAVAVPCSCWPVGMCYMIKCCFSC